MRTPAVSLLVVCGLLACSRGRAPSKALAEAPAQASAKAPAPVMPTFQLVASLSDTPSAGEVAPCLYGRHPAGLRVLLLSASDASTCERQTAEVRDDRDEDFTCTLLVGPQRCDLSGRRYQLGAIGARGDYRPLEATDVPEGPDLEALRQVVARERLVEAASERWKATLAKEREQGGVQSFGAELTDAISWPGLEGAPVLVRMKAEGDHLGVGGPWVALSGGKVVGLLGPLSMPRSPSAFVLDGRGYLRVDLAGCTGCDHAWTELHVVEQGKLRRVLEAG